MHRLKDEAGLSISAVQQVESGGDFFRGTEEKIIAAFERHRVEITNGDGTGARLRGAQA
jgi:hypothetical protein